MRSSAQRQPAWAGPPRRSQLEATSCQQVVSACNGSRPDPKAMCRSTAGGQTVSESGHPSYPPHDPYGQQSPQDADRSQLARDADATQPIGTLPPPPRNRFGAVTFGVVVLGALLAVFPATAVLGILLCLFAIIPAIFAFRRVRKGRATNRRLSLAALVLAPVFFIVAAIVVGATAPQPAITNAGTARPTQGSTATPALQQSPTIIAAPAPGPDLSPAPAAPSAAVLAPLLSPVPAPAPPPPPIAAPAPTRTVAPKIQPAPQPKPKPEPKPEAKPGTEAPACTGSQRPPGERLLRELHTGEGRRSRPAPCRRAGLPRCSGRRQRRHRMRVGGVFARPASASKSGRARSIRPARP